MSDASYAAEDALLVAEIGGLRAEGRPDVEIWEASLTLGWLRLRHGRLDPAGAVVDELLAATEGRPDLSDQRLRAEYLSGRIALARGDAAHAIAIGQATLSKLRELEADGDVPHAEVLLSRALALAGRAEEATRLLEQALEQFELTDQLEHAAFCALMLAHVVPQKDQRDLLERALALAKSSGDDSVIGTASLSYGSWHAARDEYLPARHLLDRSLPLLDRAGDADSVEAALTELAWLHLRGFALDDAEQRSNELLERALDDRARAQALEARGLSRQRKHHHALARADFAAAARALWASGERSRAVSFWLRVGQNQILVWLHALGLVRSEPHRNAVAENLELLAAFGSFVALTSTWGVLCLATSIALKPSVPLFVSKAILIAGLLPMLAFAACVLLDLHQALAAARRRKG